MAANPFTELELKLDALTRMVADLGMQLQGRPASSTEKPLSVDEAAAYLNTPKGTLYGLTSRREIPHIKRGKRLVFIKSELDTWLQDHRKKTASEIISEG